MWYQFNKMAIGRKILFRIKELADKDLIPEYGARYAVHFAGHIEKWHDDETRRQPEGAGCFRVLCEDGYYLHYDTCADNLFVPPEGNDPSMYPANQAE